MHSLQVYCARTRTVVGCIIRHAIDFKYNHCAIGLDNSRILYSFSRYFYYIWFTGVYRHEDTSYFDEYLCYDIQLSDEEYERIRSIIDNYESGFHFYNYLSAAMLPLQIAVPPVGTCSTFTAQILNEIVDLSKSPLLYTPRDIFNLMEVQNFEKKSIMHIDRAASCNKSCNDRL